MAVSSDDVDTLTEVVTDFLSFFRDNIYLLFLSVLIFVVTYGVLSSIQRIAQNISERVPRRRRLLIKQLIPFLQGFIWFVVGISWVAFLVQKAENVDPSNLAAALFLGLGFAFKDYVSSIVAGIVNLIERPFRMGDRIQIGEHYGEVVNYGLRGLQLQTPDDNAVTIPHSATWTDPISNANSGQLEAQVVTTFYVAHNADINLVIDILYQAAYSSRYTQLKNAVEVIVSEERWATQLQLKAYPMDARNEFVYKTDLVLRVKEACKQQQIPYPQLPVAESQLAES